MRETIRVAAVEPWDSDAPRILGPERIGASAGKPFLYAIPATGERPITFGAEGLPPGLCCDSATGHLAGVAERECETRVLFKAENRHGKAERECSLVIGGKLALTPPMGWNSWNAWRRWVDDGKVRAAADGLVRTGLALRGYTHVNIDSCWQGKRGGPFNAIQPNRKFPDMAALGRHIHALGLKFGIYSTPWVHPWGATDAETEADWGGPSLIGCSGGEKDPASPANPYGKYIGIEKFEPNDAAQWAAWEADFLKYDWCPFDADSLERMGRPLKAAGRDIVLSLCTPVSVDQAGPLKTWCQMWRNTSDTADNWAVLRKVIDSADQARDRGWHPHVGPGAWHDLDMLALGPQFLSQDATCANKLTPAEQVAHMTAWAIYPSPLILSCDLNGLSDFELRLFGNEEVIAVNQDRLGKPAVGLREERVPVDSDRPLRVRRIWAKPLTDNRYAAALFNLGESDDAVTLEFRDLGLSGKRRVRDVWARRDLGAFEERVTLSIPAHGAKLVRVT